MNQKTQGVRLATHLSRVSEPPWRTRWATHPQPRTPQSARTTTKAQGLQGTTWMRQQENGAARNSPRSSRQIETRLRTTGDTRLRPTGPVCSRPPQLFRAHQSGVQPTASAFSEATSLACLNTVNSTHGGGAHAPRRPERATTPVAGAPVLNQKTQGVRRDPRLSRVSEPPWRTRCATHSPSRTPQLARTINQGSGSAAHHVDAAARQRRGEKLPAQLSANRNASPHNR